MNDHSCYPQPGDVLRLRRTTDGIRPGAFLVLHVEDASAMLCRINAPKGANALQLCRLVAEDHLDEASLCRTNVYNLAFFEDTGLSVAFEEWQESVSADGW